MNARVGPRQGTTHDIDLYYASDPQDQIRTMLQIELFRRRYRATKVTTKMVFAVDYFSRPLDHFLSDGSHPSAESRVVTHDTTQWSGQEAAPTHTIRRADQLHRTLHAIQDAAAMWYPDDLARVFRAIHSNANHAVHAEAPEALVSATCNLYTTVFRFVFNSILSGVHLRDLEIEVNRMLSRDSAEYQQYVGAVLHDAMIQSVFRGRETPFRPLPARTPPPANPGGRRRNPPGGRRAPAPPGCRPPQVQQRVLPQHIYDLTPVVGDKKVCLRFQTMFDCDLKCNNEHKLVKLPEEVITWLVDRHGSLKSDHPSFL